MNLYDNSYDTVCTLPFEVRIYPAEFYPTVTTIVDPIPYNLSTEEGGDISIAWALTYFFRRYFPVDEFIQFKINAVNIKHFSVNDECLDYTQYTKIFKYHILGYGFRPSVPYITPLTDRLGIISNYDITHFNFSSDEGETTWEFGVKDMPGYGSYISYKNDWNIFPDNITGKIPFTGYIIPNVTAFYVYRLCLLRIHISIRTNN